MRATLTFLFSLVPCLVLGAGQPLDPILPGPTAEQVRGSTTAFSGGHFLTVWQQEIAGAWHLYAAVSDEEGRRISAGAFPVVQFTQVGDLKLVGIESGFALFWRDFYGNATHMARLDGDGELLSNQVLDLNHIRLLDAAWNGSHFLIAMGSPAKPESEALLLDSGGQIVHRVSLGPDTFDADVAALSDGGFFIATASRAGLRALRVSSDGQITSTDLVEASGGLRTTDYYPAYPHVSTMLNGDVLVGFAVLQHERAPRLKTARITTLGLAGAPVEIPTPALVAIDSVAITVTSDTVAIYFRGTRTREGNPDYEVFGVVLDSAGRPAVAPATVAADLRYEDRFSYSANSFVTFAVNSAWGRGEQIASRAMRRPSETTAQVLSLTPAQQSEVRVAANSAGFLAAWNDFAGDRTSIRVAALDDDGAPISETSSLPGDLASHTIASGPAGHLILRATGSDLIATQLAPTGRVLQEWVLGPAYPLRYAAAAAWTGSGFVVAVGAQDRLLTFYLASHSAMSVSDTPIAPVEILLPPPPPQWRRFITNVRVAWDGKDVLLFWSDSLWEPCYIPGYCIEHPALRAQHLTTFGTPTAAAPIDIAETALAPAVAASDDGFLVTLPFSPTFYSITMDPTMEVRKVSSALPFIYTVTDLAWNGKEFVALLTAFESYVALAKIDRDGAFRGPHAVIASHGRSRSERMGVDGSRILVARAIAAPLVPFRAYVHTVRDFQTPPPLPPRTSVVSIHREGRGQTMVSWQQVDGADGYLIESLTPAGWAMAAMVHDRSATSRTVYRDSTEEFRVRAFNAAGVSPLQSRSRVARP